MKVLWICSMALSCVAKEVGQNVVEGGWLSALYSRLSENKDLALSVAFPCDGLSAIKEIKDGTVSHYAVPRTTLAYGSDIGKVFAKIVDIVKPDIIHIHGTEYSHGLSLMDCRPNENYVVSMQGLISICAEHYYAGMPQKAINAQTFRDIIRHDGIKQAQQKFVERGIYEKEMLKRVKNVIGRTEWDKACAKLLAPNAAYHRCNETLRACFYDKKWNVSSCERHSIFVSQGRYPLKGLHKVLEAMPLILRQYPNTRLYVAGLNVTKTDTLQDKLRLSGYGKYLNKLIKENDLQSHIVFTGNLNEEQMCERFLQSHAFISASSIENSPNSLGEANLLGVPAVCSYVGGAPSMMTHGVGGYFYPFDEPYMMAHYICQIFSDDALAASLSESARQHAAPIYDGEANAKRQMAIYAKICEDIH